MGWLIMELASRFSIQIMRIMPLSTCGLCLSVYVPRTSFFIRITWRNHVSLKWQGTMKSLHGAQLKAKSAQVSWFLGGKQKNLGASSSLPHLTWAASRPTVYGWCHWSSKVNHDQAKDTYRLRHWCSVQPVAWATHKYGSYKELFFFLFFFYNRVLCSGISLDSHASKRPRPI